MERERERERRARVRVCACVWRRRVIGSLQKHAQLRPARSSGQSAAPSPPPPRRLPKSRGRSSLNLELAQPYIAFQILIVLSGSIAHDAIICSVG